MINSMTGFGRAELMTERRKFTVEMKSVNHRYLDFNIKLPKKFAFFEAAARSVIKEYITRGKVDVFITTEDLAGGNMQLIYNQDLAGQYVSVFAEMAERFAIPNDCSASILSRCPEVLSMTEATDNEEELWADLERCIRSAAEQFVLTRNREGEHLRDNLYEKLDGMLVNVDKVEARAPQIVEAYRKRITDKVQELLGDAQIEETRLASEVILFADKICTDEETVRLRSHIDHMKKVLADGKDVGRKLDFIAQEMNREANTILSKANDLETSNIAIELKTDIEKVREQIQNIE